MTTDPTYEPIVSETRERIVRAAMELFRMHGFHNTSLAQVLEQARTTKGGFYFHFESKEQLGFAVLERARDFWIDNVIDVISHEPDVRSRIHRMVEIMTDMYRGDIYHGCALLAVLTAEMMEHPTEFADRIKSILNEWRESIVEILEKGKADGIFRHDIDSNALALILIGCCQGATMMGHLDPERVNYDQLLHDLEQWILEGVARR